MGNAAGLMDPVVAWGWTQAHGIHQEQNAREAPGVGQVEFRDLVRLDLLDWMQDADLFIPERLVERA
jgi:hypothetical protein